MEFLLLGPLLVRSGTALIPIPQGKQRALLAALAVRNGRVVAASELAELIWEGRPPRSARPTLHNYVKRLRHALGEPGKTLIQTRPPGYLIAAEPGDVDVIRFAALCGSGKEAARRGYWDQAAAQLQVALSMWRGQPFVDIPCGLLADSEVPRLAELRAAALEDRIDADLHLGRHHQVIGELRALASAEPLRERLHLLLMLALYRAGRPAAALTAYQQARSTLISELGLEPGAALRQLQQQILSADPALDLPPSLNSRPAPSEVAGPGRTAGLVVPRQLPTAPAHFAGRMDELQEMTGLLEMTAGTVGTALISAIGGSAGVGKTALAVYWAHQAAGQFPDGQLYVSLRGFGPKAAPVKPQEALTGFLEAIQPAGVPIPTGLEAKASLYRSLLAGRRMLIILDNARDEEQVRPLLPASPGCLVLVTSRSQLTGLVAAEGARPLTLDMLTDADADLLLARHLGTDRTAAEPRATADLIRLCAGLPLALAITAARAAEHPRHPLAAAAAELRNVRSRLDVLDAGDAAASVRAAFSWSYQSLTEPAARMFRLLGVHPGPDITAPAAASLAAVPGEQARRQLGELARAHLIAEHSAGRFALHDLLRAYAAEQAEVTDPDELRRAAVQRGLDHYLHTAQSAADIVRDSASDAIILPPAQPGVIPERIADYEQVMAWFSSEYRVLLAAVAQAASEGFDSHAWQLPWVLTTFLIRRGYWHDCAATLETALAAAQRLGDQQAQARVHHSLGRATTLLGCYRKARAHCQQSLEMYRQLGDRAGQGRAHHGIGMILERQGRFRQSLGHDLKALRLYRAAGDLACQAVALNNVGWCHAHVGDYRQAMTHCQKAIALFRERGDRCGEAAAWDSVGYTEHRFGRPSLAVASYQRAVALLLEPDERYLQATIRRHLGDAYQTVGDLRAAADAWRQATAILDEMHHPDARLVRAKLADLDRLRGQRVPAADAGLSAAIAGCSGK